MLDIDSQISIRVAFHLVVSSDRVPVDWILDQEPIWIVIHGYRPERIDRRFFSSRKRDGVPITTVQGITLVILVGEVEEILFGVLAWLGTERHGRPVKEVKGPPTGCVVDGIGDQTPVVDILAEARLGVLRDDFVSCFHGAS